MIASVEGNVGAIASDSLVIETGGIGYRVYRRAGDPRDRGSRLAPQAAHVSPRPRGPAGAVRVRVARGPRLLHAAADGHRRRAEGRARDRRIATRGRSPAGDPSAGPGSPRVDPRHRQEAGRARHLRVEGEGGRGRQRGRGERRVAVPAGTRARWSRHCRRSGTRSGRRAELPGPRWRSSPSRRRSRSVSRRLSGRSSGTERPGPERPSDRAAERASGAGPSGRAPDVHSSERDAADVHSDPVPGAFGPCRARSCTADVQRSE